MFGFGVIDEQTIANVYKMNHLEAIVHGLSTLNNMRRARTHLINECIKWAKSDIKLKELGLVLLHPHRRSSRRKRNHSGGVTGNYMKEQVNGLIELVARKYMRTCVKAALRYLMDEIGIGSGTEIRQVLKVTAELKLETVTEKTPTYKCLNKLSKANNYNAAHSNYISGPIYTFLIFM